MAFDDGLEPDEPAFRTPPPPDDRLWRHPSELPAAPASRARSPRRRSSLGIVVLAGSAGALFATGVIALTVGLEEPRPSGGALVREVVERRAPDADPIPSVAPNPGANAAAPATGDTVVDIAQRVRPAITQVRVGDGRGENTGSGVMFRSDGLLLTNAHVVDEANDVDVVLADGTELPGRVLGRDVASDTAVVKVDGGPHPVATLGSAADLKVGQQAIAIGSPLGLAGGPSVSVGVVSALHRRVEVKSGPPLLDMVQTDAPISPGSSGGALLDSSGSVIGITTAIAVSDIGAEGLGFAVPVDMARGAADQLVADGKVVHVWIGIEGTDLDAASARELGVGGGALVGRVMGDSPAATAGMEERDVVVGVDDREVTSMGSLVVNLRGHRPGDVVTLQVAREGQRLPMQVRLAERPRNS